MKNRVSWVFISLETNLANGCFIVVCFFKWKIPTCELFLNQPNSQFNQICRVPPRWMLLHWNPRHRPLHQLFGIDILQSMVVSSNSNFGGKKTSPGTAQNGHVMMSHIWYYLDKNMLLVVSFDIVGTIILSHRHSSSSFRGVLFLNRKNTKNTVPQTWWRRP